MWHEQTQKHEFGCFYTTSEHKNHSKKKIWDRLCLRNIQNSKNLMKYYNVE